MKTVVLAYHDMGLAGLEALDRHHFNIMAVFTHEDDPGENCWFGSVKEWCRIRQIPCWTPENINSAEWIDKISGMRPDVLFSFYYRKMIRPEILQIPRLGAFNLHGSLLPAYRGRCPVNWVLVKGENRTGITLHYMIDKPDAGDIVCQQAVPIDDEDTAQTLYGKLCRAAGRLLDNVLLSMKTGQIPRRKQDLTQGSYYGGRRPEDGRIDWNHSAREIYNLIRAVTDPYPGAFAFLPGGQQVLIWWGEPVEISNAGEPGTVLILGQDVLVKTGNSAIKLLDIEVDGQRLKDDSLVEFFKKGKVCKLQ